MNKSPASEQQTARPADWKTWPSVTVLVRGLPKGVTTQDLWEAFNSNGDLSYIDVFQNQGLPAWSGRLRFEPPPSTAFWQSGTAVVDVRCGKSSQKRRCQVAVGLDVKSIPRGWMIGASDKKYPRNARISPKSLGFASLTGNRAIQIRKTIEPTEERPYRISFDFQRQTFAAHFWVGDQAGRSGPLQLKLMADLKIVRRAYICHNANDEPTTLTLSLLQVPKYFFRIEEVQPTLKRNPLNWTSRDCWFRATNIAHDIEQVNRHPVGVYNDIDDPGYIELGRWTTLHLAIHGQTSETVDQVIWGLEDHNVKIEKMPEEDLRVTTGDIDMWTLLDKPESYHGAAQLLASTAQVYLPFEVRYQLEACVSHGVLNEHNVTVEFLKILSKMEPSKARGLLEYLVDFNRVLRDPMDLLDDPKAAEYSPNFGIPSYCVLVRKVSLTPTTAFINSPAIETSNRVVRHWGGIRGIGDRFLRVQLVEEHGSGRVSMQNPEDDEVRKRVLRMLHKGIRIGDRVYEFLAFGNSQLRQRGLYFFCPSDHVSCDDIRQWMGSFTHIRNVAKWSARLGQCFSTSRDIRSIAKPWVKTVDDIERNGYCFSDGSGRMSTFVADCIHNELQANDVFAERPTAFQFRMSGVKGLLVVWPNMAQGMEVHVRPSQEKFKANSKNLEIVRCAKYATATLNRQTITILESLGVPNSAFMVLLQRQLRDYDSAMEDNEVAVDVLTRAVDENQTTLILAELIKAGFHRPGHQDPFVSNTLKLWRASSLKILKSKARIYVEESAFVLGCVDETSTLRGHSSATEGSKSKDVDKLPQIFLQMTDPRDDQGTKIATGVCIVGRNPSLHPGDIRVVEAVDVPALHHLRNVVVFPSTGDRPLPHMLAGGDLDGDDFFVIWDKSLIPKEWNHPPMDYQAPPPKILDRDVTVKDMKNFFLEYLQNDCLGLVATAHVGLADQKGPKSPQCLQLAQLHSEAVDYNKTGQPAKWKSSMQPKQWPHFMELKSTYYSRKALGLIYDTVVRVPAQFKPDWELTFDERVLEHAQHLDPQILDKARGIKVQYDASLQRILTQQKLETEFELWSGFAMSDAIVGTYYKQWEDLAHEYNTLKHHFREICYEAAGGKSLDKMGPFVAAMYRVTEEQARKALMEPDEEPFYEDGDVLPVHTQPRKPLISFPWLFPTEMIRLAKGPEYYSKGMKCMDGTRGSRAVQVQETVRVLDSMPKTGSDSTPEAEDPGEEQSLTFSEEL